jgi:hypothetical protein
MCLRVTSHASHSARVGVPTFARRSMSRRPPGWIAVDVWMKGDGGSVPRVMWRVAVRAPPDRHVVRQ